jgi:L-fuculose-phosphate aldolase
VVRVPDNVKRDLLQVCKRLYERGLVAGSDGNVSVRLDRDHLLATPTGMCKGLVGEGDLVGCDLQGKQLSGTRRLTTEIKIHLAVYTQRDDVCAVVHAHPPFATAFAVAGITPSEKLMPEAYIAVGKVALAPYGTPSTDELAEKIRAAVATHDAVLLANHGAMTFGSDVVGAYHRMEALEQLCKITFIARQLGGAKSLAPEDMAKLDAIRGVYGAADANVPCYHCGRAPDGSGGFALEPRPATGAGGEARVEGTRPAIASRPAAYVPPDVHWPGNPPVWERPGSPSTIEEAQVRDLARRALRALENE